LVAKKRFVIKTLDGSIEMLDVQAPGKRIMSAKDFLNGQTFFVEGDGFEEGSF
jgi:methionyl-tRNA formyltransferase